MKVEFDDRKKTIMTIAAAMDELVDKGLIQGPKLCEPLAYHHVDQFKAEGFQVERDCIPQCVASLCKFMEVEVDEQTFTNICNMIAVKLEC